MGIPFIAIFITCITIFFNLKSRRAMNRTEDVRRAFWERERRANMARKKSLEDLPYVKIPEDIPPEITEALSGDARDAARRVKDLREEDAKIVNLTGYSNTDLKLEYGAANINDLIVFDTNYTTLVTSLQECAKALYDAEKYPEAQRVLEFSVQTGTDIAASYKMLIDLYRTRLFLDKESSDARIRALETNASVLRTINKDSILRTIREALGEEAVSSETAAEAQA